MHAVAVADHPLEALERALDAERRALLDNDVDALLSSTAAKLDALRRAESAQPGVIAAERLEALRQQNQDNGVLLSRRRREVGWALRHIGRVESTGVYDSRGQPGARPQARCLGVG
jgi:flagellar biosynthesis/type III secretory pathway chaperone